MLHSASNSNGDTLRSVSGIEMAGGTLASTNSVPFATNTDYDGSLNPSTANGGINGGVSGGLSPGSSNGNEQSNLLDGFPQPVVSAALAANNMNNTAGGIHAQGEGGPGISGGDSDDDVLFNDNNGVAKDGAATTGGRVSAVNINIGGMGMGMAPPGDGGNGNNGGMSTDAINRAKNMGWETWKSDKVVQWLEYELMTNYGLDSQEDQLQVKSFIQEFKKHNVNGKILQRIKSDPNFDNLRYLQSGFSDQSMGLWIAVKDAVSELP